MPEDKKKKMKTENEVKKVKEEKKKTKEMVDNEAKPGKDEIPKAVQDPNEDKSKPEPKPTPEPEMNKVIKDKVVDKTAEKEPTGDLIDPHIKNLEKDIEKTIDIVSELEDMFATSVDSDKFKEINDFIDNFGNLKEAPEDEIPEDIPEIDEVEDETEDEDEIEITSIGDDEINVDVDTEDDKTQAIVTIDMPSDVEPEDVNVDVDVEKKNDEMEADLEMPEDTEIDDEDLDDIEDINTDVEDETLPEINDDDIELEDEEELLDNLNKFVDNILNESEDQETDELEKEQENIDNMLENLNKVLLNKDNDDPLHALESFVEHLDKMIKEESQMDQAKKNVEDKFKDPDADEKEEKKEKSESEIDILPIAENASWSAVAANKRVLETAIREDTTINFDILSKAYLYVEKGHENDIDAYQYQIADVINGKLYAIPKAIQKLTDLFSNNLTLKSLRVKEEVINEVRSKLEKYLEKMGEEIPWNSDEENGNIRFQEANGLLSIYTAYEQFDPFKVISKLQENEDKR